MYAVWKPNPQVTITSNPTSVTAVAGNPVTVGVGATGNGTLSYQWYYNSSNSNSGGTAISGATGTTYSFTASTSRYYYCIVTSNVAGSTASRASATALITVQAANYCTTRSGTTTYYNTLAQAVSGATSGGGDAGGGTITVLNSITDTSGVSTNKTITINVNGKTLTRTSSITTSGGTLTISGGGTMYCTQDTALIRSTGGNITTNGGTLRSASHVISSSSANCVLIVNGGYLYSDGGASINSGTIYGKGRTTINMEDCTSVEIKNNAYVFVPWMDKNAIAIRKGNGRGELVITGNGTRIGNGSTFQVGTNGNYNVPAGAISFAGSTLNIRDSARVMGGPHGGPAVALYSGATLNCTGSSCLYASRQSIMEGFWTAEDDATCVTISGSGCKVIFNSTGYFYCTAAYVANANNYAATYTVTKGHFVSRYNQYMFYQNGKAVTTYAASNTKGERTFCYMNAFNSVPNKKIPNCYYYTKGV